MRIHPRFQTLSRYVAGELSQERRARIASHLADCPRCREVVQTRRVISELLLEEPIPGLPEETFQRILARRSAGERMILPTADPAVRSRSGSRRIPAIAAAAVLLLGGALGVLRTPELEAGASELHILPEQPRAGQELRVEYRATAKLGGEDRLVLRARFFTSGPQLVARHTTVAHLSRGEDRTFRGAFHLPDSVVYAAFAVEDVRGERVDHDPAEWEVVVHGPDGRPLLSALERKVEYREQWDTERALETAREMTRLYPDSVAGWFRRYVREKYTVDQAGGDSLRAAYRERLRALERHREQDPRIAPEEMSKLAFFAGQVGDSTAERRWIERLIREHPTHYAGVQRRVFAAGKAHPGDLPGLFAAYERLWEEVGATSLQLPFSAFMRARSAGDAQALLRWGERLEQANPALRAFVARTFSEVPALRSEAMGRLREQIHHLEADGSEERPLGKTVEEHRRSRQQARGFFLGQLGRALIEDGQPDAALDTLARAVEAAWNVELFRMIAETKLAMGDTAGAVPVLARIAADPGTSAVFSDSVPGRVGRHFDAQRWAEWMEAGREEMNAYVWSRAVNRALRGRVRLTDLEGESHAFQAQSEGPTFVAFWSRHCPPSLMQLRQLQQISEELRARGVRVVTITKGETASSAAEFLGKNDYTFPVFFDAEQDAQRAFDNRATPRYFVLDGSGRVRFDSYSPDDILREVTVLRALSPGPAGK